MCFKAGARAGRALSSRAASRRTRGMGQLSTRPLGRRVEEPFWKQTLSVKEKPSEYFRRSARVQKAEEHRSLRGREDGVDPKLLFPVRPGVAL
jgi:hypothetical protein